MSGQVPQPVGGQQQGNPLDVIELAQALIRTPSPNPPGDEQAVAQLLSDLMSECGLPKPTVAVKAVHRPNLITTVDFGTGGRHLVLSGHLDTKPIGDANWSVDPFGAEIVGDQLYGLGAGDMKAAIAAMVVAAGRLAHEPHSAGRLSLVFTADEEDGARYGAHHVCSVTRLGADAVVIGEPGGIDRDFDRLHLVSRGIARLRVVARGAQGHSSLSGEKGWRNAGVDAARAATAISDDLQMPVPENPGQLVGWHATVNTGLAFRGGVGYGVLPGEMQVDTEVRLLPGMARDDVAAALRERLAAVAADTGADLEVSFDEPPDDWLPATMVPQDDLVATTARRACAAVLDSLPPDSVFPGTTDATWFNSLQGIPTLPALGPGLLRRAHAADEWVSVTAVRESVEIYAALAHEFCNGLEGPAETLGRLT
jgi:acetylornithine deacetylase/succinyl-diaminopimelate desuccinylase-like protein